MAPPATQKLTALWTLHGDRVIIGLLVLFLALGATYGIQRKAADPSDLVERIARAGETGMEGPQGPGFSAEKVLRDISAREPTGSYIEISSKNVFYTPQQWSELTRRLQRSYEQGLEHFRAGNPSGYRAALTEFDRILALDPEQLRIPYGQGKPAELAVQCRTSLKIDELNEDWNRAQQEWDRARDFETRNQPISAANTLGEAVKLYNKVVEEGATLVAQDRLAEARSRADEGTRRMNSLLSTHLTQDVRARNQELETRLAAATLELPAMVELFEKVGELQQTLDTYAEHVEDSVETTAKDRIVEARRRIDGAVPGFYSQAQAMFKSAMETRNVSAAQQVLARLNHLRKLSPELPGIDEALANTQTFIAEASRAAALAELNAENERLRAGLTELERYRRESNWNAMDGRRKELLNDEEKYLNMARSLRSPLLSQLTAHYTRIKEYVPPREADFIEIVRFEPRAAGNRVVLKNNRSGNTMRTPYPVGQSWPDGGVSIRIEEIDLANGTVKISVPGYRVTTLTQKR